MIDVPVLFDHQIFALQVHGGISRYFVNMVRELPRFRIAPKVLAPLHINEYLAAAETRILGVGVRLPYSVAARRIAMASGSLSHRLLASLERASIVHETYYSRRRIAPAKSRVVLTVYDMIHELWPENFPDDSTVVAKAAAIRRADHIVCISESTRRDLLHFFPEVEDRCSVTLLGFDRPGIDMQADIPNPAGGRPYILYVGARGGYKNFSGLLAAYAASPALRDAACLVCVGGGAFSAPEAGAIATAGLSGCVFQARADDQELHALYKHAACFVYPSLYEGFGIPPLEAMANECPVVACHASSIPEVCGDAVEYFEAGSLPSMIAALEAVVLSTERSDELRCKGGINISRFSWAHTAAQTAAIYQELV